MSLPDTGGGSTVGSVLWAAADRHPARIAVVDVDGRETSYAELFARAGRPANFLTASGLTVGDRVGAWLDDGVGYIALYLACARAGLVVVPFNARYTVHEMRALVEDSEPRCLVWEASKDGAVETLRDEGLLDGLELLRHAVDGSSALGAADLDSVCAQGEPRLPDRATADGLFVIGYTSGTTGQPKGAMLSHRSVCAILRQHPVVYRLPQHSTIAMTGSMSFVSVVPAHVLTHLSIAGTVVFLGHWDVPSLLGSMQRHGVTFTYLPSPVVLEFADRAAQDAARWASLQSVLHSASKVSADALGALVEVVGDRLVEGWGMTENSGGLMTATTAADVRSRRPGVLDTVGRPVAGYEVCVVDDELHVRGPGMVTGYWRRPEASAASFRDGWYASGDIGTIDDDGYVTLVERRTDLIVSGGMNVYPAEVETVIARLPGVAQVAVVGVPHPRGDKPSWPWWCLGPALSSPGTTSSCTVASGWPATRSRLRSSSRPSFRAPCP